MATRTIDWEAIHCRLAVTAASVAGGVEHDSVEVRRILDARARAAAKPHAAPDDSARLEVLAFTLGSETYGVETRHVREVCQLRELTHVPCTPSFVAGVMNLRGQLLAVVDLRKCFELPTRGLGELNRIIVLSGPNTELGLLADSIDGVRSVAMSELQEGLPTLTDIRDKYLRGITGQMLAVLDGARLLADVGLKVDEQVTRQAR